MSCSVYNIEYSDYIPIFITEIERILNRYCIMARENAPFSEMATLFHTRTGFSDFPMAWHWMSWSGASIHSLSPYKRRDRLCY